MVDGRLGTDIRAALSERLFRSAIPFSSDRNPIRLVNIVSTRVVARIRRDSDGLLDNRRREGTPWSSRGFVCGELEAGAVRGVWCGFVIAPRRSNWRGVWSVSANSHGHNRELAARMMTVLVGHALIRSSVNRLP